MPHTDRLADAFADTVWLGDLRRQQAEALGALESGWRQGRRRAWLVLPPGAGKTLVGLEAARRLAGLTPAGADNVAFEIDRDGIYRAALTGVSVEASTLFAMSLDELLAPLGSPRYVVPRYMPTPPADLRRAGRTWLNGEDRPNAVVYHAVPAALGVNARRVAAFRRAWQRWVSAGMPVYSTAPRGPACSLPSAARTRRR